MTRMTTAQNTDLARKVAALEARLALLEKALKVGVTGDVTLKGTSLTIESTSLMNIKSATSLDIKGGLIKLN